VGKIDRDQVTDYARREGLTVEQAESNLAPNLGYLAQDQNALEVA
jgi:5-methyltetrahydrofolate--homocysteine methyltransferase